MVASRLEIARKRNHAMSSSNLVQWKENGFWNWDRLKRRTPPSSIVKRQACCTLLKLTSVVLHALFDRQGDPRSQARKILAWRFHTLARRPANRVRPDLRILYHMQDPVRLLELIATHTNTFYVWTTITT
jgi:hypothetical protein